MAQSLLDLLALPAMSVFPTRLEDVTPDSLVDVIIEITQYTGLFNAAGTPCTAQPIRQRAPACRPAFSS